MANTSNINGIEFIHVADAVAKEKGIARHIIIAAMEQAIAAASRKKYGQENQINVKIHQTTGEIKISRERTIVEEVLNPQIEISLPEALEKDPEAVLGGIIAEALPPVDLARVAAGVAKQVMMQKIKDAEREKQYEEFKDKVGEIVNGSVRRIEFGNIVLELGRGEAVLKKENLIPGEVFKPNDRIRAYIEDVRNDAKGHQIVLSRSAPGFLAALFAQEVPEVYDKVIEIKGIAREPGAKAKVAVYTSDTTLDPVGSCVGVRGSRITNIINELNGERIDIVKWAQDPARFVINSLTPAQITKVIINEEGRKINVIVPTDQLSIAIGKRGQNVRLASKLTGWNIDIMTEDEESKRRITEFNSVSKLFMENLGLEEVYAQLLASEGYSSLEDIAYINEEELATIEGIGPELAEKLISKAQTIVLEKSKVIATELERLGVDKALVKILDMLDMNQILILANAGIKAFEDLAEISAEEFKKILPDSDLSDQEIKTIIEIAVNRK